MNLHITPNFNIDRLCKTASVLLFLVLVALPVVAISANAGAAAPATLAASVVSGGYHGGALAVCGSFFPRAGSLFSSQPADTGLDVGTPAGTVGRCFFAFCWVDVRILQIPLAGISKAQGGSTG